MGHVYKVLGESNIPDKPDYFKDRFIIELCENIHVHYREMRLEFSNTEFCEIYRVVSRAFKTLQKTVLEEAPTIDITLDKINPFDEGHKRTADSFDCGKSQKYHREGIDYVKQNIKAGKVIRPIAVVYDSKINMYQRMDGFKRYWAYKELNKETIPCKVFTEYIGGIQEGLTEFV